MPIYEYVCPQCNIKFELKRLFSESGEDVPCPHCHTSSKRILSIFSSFSTDESGLTTPIAGSSPCSSCSTTSCDTCNL